LEHRHGTTMERLREHLARANGELEAAQRFLDPGTRDEARILHYGFRPSYDRGGAKHMAEGRIKWYSPQVGHGFSVHGRP
jgi:hypothetical protein